MLLYCSKICSLWCQYPSSSPLCLSVAHCHWLCANDCVDRKLRQQEFQEKRELLEFTNCVLMIVLTGSYVSRSSRRNVSCWSSLRVSWINWRTRSRSRSNSTRTKWSARSCYSSDWYSLRHVLSSLAFCGFVKHRLRNDLNCVKWDVKYL